MDQTHQVITKVQLLEMPKVTIETNTGKRYFADLSRFKSVYCFPKSTSEWSEASITTAGYSLTWPGRFEVHVDQIIDHSISCEDIKRTA